MRARYSNVFKKASCGLLALLLSFSFCTISHVNIAYCDSIKSDFVVSGTIEKRGIKPSVCPDIASKSAILKSSDGKLFFSRDATKSVKIASLTKLMTALVACENASLDDEVIISKEAFDVGGSSAGFAIGDKMTLKSALYGLMIPSGNDAAEAIAESVGRKLTDSTDLQARARAFVDKMNEKASAMGLSDTLFTNAHGLDEGNFESDAHSNANDVMAMIEEVMKIDLIRDIAENVSYEIPIIRNDKNVTVKVNTTDSLLGNFEGACGIKTGTTDKAGYCFAGACNRNGVMMYSVILGATTSQDRFSDTQKLFNWYFDNVIDYNPISADGEIVARVAHSDWIDKTVPATVDDIDKKIRLFKYSGNVSQSVNYDNLTGNIKKGDKVGEISFWQNNQCILTENLVAAENVDAPGILENISIAFNRFLSLFNNSKYTSDSVLLNSPPLMIKYS